MINKILQCKFFTPVLFIFLCAFSSAQNKITIDDSNGILAKTGAPVSIEIQLNKNQLSAAKEGRLILIDTKTKLEVPIQLENYSEGEYARFAAVLPKGDSGAREFNIIEKSVPLKSTIKATLDSKSGQAIIEEENKKVLQYNYQTVYEKDVIRNQNEKNIKSYNIGVTGVYFNEYLKANPKIKKDTTVTTRIYAIPRSDYIHPLYGLNGEMLTRDWPDAGHPHHRGIFWAWPEVEWDSQRGDIYALQRVFARPNGNIKFTSGPVFAQIIAENLWMWEDSVPIVNEQAKIRVYQSTAENRIIDLTIKLLALKDNVTIATRLTNSYGGLNVRMQTPKKQDISYFTDKKDSNPRRAWSDFNGIFKGNNSVSGMMVLQHQNNPEYPGVWREYPNLAWVQPTFPTPNTRYPVSKTEPLILRYRLIIHTGGKPGKITSQLNWDAYHLKQLKN